MGNVSADLGGCCVLLPQVLVIRLIALHALGWTVQCGTKQEEQLIPGSISATS